MLKEFVDGFNDSEKVFEKSEKLPEAVTSQITPDNVPEHLRLSWLLYLAPDCKTIPGRSSVFSRFHAADQRVPEIFAEQLQHHKTSITGIFSEALSSSEDLGYIVFSNNIDAVLISGGIAAAIEQAFKNGIEKCGYMYAEIELSVCQGSLTAPGAVVKKRVLINQGFDCAAPANDDIVELSSDLIS